MKTICLLSLFLISVSAKSQLNQLYGVWVNGSNDAFILYDSSIYPGVFTEFNDHQTMLRVSLKSDTLMFYNSTASYDFELINNYDSALVLRPITEQSINAFEKWDVLFRKQEIELPKLKSFQFKYECYSCESYDVEITESGRFRKTKYLDFDTLYYESVLDSIHIQNLEYLISTSFWSSNDTDLDKSNVLSMSHSKYTYDLRMSDYHKSFSTFVRPVSLRALNFYVLMYLCQEYEMEKVERFKLRK
ncbi:MAG: hypothetical protein NXI20_01580 [bacterium]|nr:hypothetical protein [bacterium]